MSRSSPATADQRELMLALLEEQPYTTSDLARVAGLRGCAVAGMLRALVREGAVTRLPDWRWTVETTTPDAPPAVPARRTAPPKAQWGSATTIWSPRFVVPAETTHAPDAGPRTRVINGVEYEITWNGCGPIPRPGDDGRSTGASSLAAFERVSPW